MAASASAGKRDTPIYIERKITTEDAAYGTDINTWVSIVMKPGSPSEPQPIMAQWQDARPGRSEAVQQGFQIARNQTTLTIAYRRDVNSTMRVRKVADVQAYGEAATVYNIIGGPAELGRKRGLEMVIERYTP